MNKPTLYVVTDIETTRRKRITFDVAWKIVDRHGNVYGVGSYIITEAFKLDVPYFAEKLGWYFEDCHAGLIIPKPLAFIRAEYNRQISELQAQGYRIVFVAYNAAFDSKYLGETSRLILNERFLTTRVELMDLWDAWCLSAPRDYNLKTEKGNPKTKAESVYAYEFGIPDFEERHIAFADVEIETEILWRVLSRKKTMPIVDNPAKFNGQPWRRLLSYPAYQSANLQGGTDKDATPTLPLDLPEAAE